MESKGLFDIIYVLIIMLFFLPSIYLPSIENVNKNLTHIDEVALVVDEVVADALADDTTITASSCTFGANNFGTYNTKINEYINNFENERKKYTDINCSYSLENTSLSGSNPLIYQANVDITCSINKQNFENEITKKLIIYKTIRLRVDSGSCIFRVIDADVASSFIQVEKEILGYTP